MFFAVSAALNRATRLAFAALLAIGAWAVPSLFSSRVVDAVTPGTSSTCATNIGNGGDTASSEADTHGGNGCVVIETDDTVYTFNYTGAIETWTVPAGVSSVIVHLVGAGGGGGKSGTSAYGGGGGYVVGTMSVTPGQQLDIIVGQGGSRMCAADAAPLTPESGRFNFSFGGGGMGNGVPRYNCRWRWRRHNRRKRWR